MVRICGPEGKFEKRGFTGCDLGDANVHEDSLLFWLSSFFRGVALIVLGTSLRSSSSIHILNMVGNASENKKQTHGSVGINSFEEFIKLSN